MRRLLIILVIALIINILSPYLFQTVPIIRLGILMTTPIGMSMDEVTEVLRSENRWRNIRGIEWRNVRRVNNTIRSHTYHLPPYIGVTWLFDDDEKLIDISISKHWTP